MEPPFVRPRVAELRFCLYDRPLHPELYETVASRSVTRDGYTLTVRLTPTGHVLSWRRDTVHLEELIVSAGLELSDRGRRLDHRVGHSRGGRYCVAGIQYQVSTQIEFLPPEPFVHTHEELARDGLRKGLIFHCPHVNRLGLAPLGVVIASTVTRGLSVTAFHTFPDELALVKSQSLIEW